jgi:uncharacterized protein (DUF2147 family)
LAPTLVADIHYCIGSGDFVKTLRQVAPAILVLLASPSFARADASITGEWLRDSGTARVRIGPCGDKLCGVITWVRDKTSPTKVGMKVFYDMKLERPNDWAGYAFNPEDEQTYSGALVLNGDKMSTTGCVIGKLFCKSVYWTRVK